MKKTLVILFILISFSVKSQTYFSNTCGFFSDTCSIGWGIQGKYKLIGQLPINFEKVWIKYTCQIIKEPIIKDEQIIEYGEIKLFLKPKDLIK